MALKLIIDISKEGNLWFMLNAIRGNLQHIAEVLSKDIEAADLDKIKAAIDQADKELTKGK